MGIKTVVPVNVIRRTNSKFCLDIEDLASAVESAHKMINAGAEETELHLVNPDDGSTVDVGLRLVFIKNVKFPVPVVTAPAEPKEPKPAKEPKAPKPAKEPKSMDDAKREAANAPDLPPVSPQKAKEKESLPKPPPRPVPASDAPAETPNDGE